MNTSIDEFIDQDTGVTVYLVTLIAETEEDVEELLRDLDGPLAVTSHNPEGTLLQFRIDFTRQPSEYDCYGYVPDKTQL